MVQAVATREDYKDIHFPKAGVDLSMAFSRQPNRPTVENEYARTTAVGQNVRGFEPGSVRVRGGSRPGLVKYLAARPGDTLWITQELAVVVGTGFNAPGGPVQLSNSGRVVTLVAVSQGSVFVTQPGGATWTAAINASGETPALNFSGLVYSAANNQKLWFADGINYVYYDASVNTVYPWKASAGKLPVDFANNTPRLIETWRGRTILSGLLHDGQNIFMSAVGDPTNFDYSPLSTSPTQAIALNLGPTGFVGDVVTTLIPYTDDVLVVGCDHSIWMMQGDPMAGGQIDKVSGAIGMAWGIPWCTDPYGNIYFISNRTGIYTLVPGQQPQRISQPIEQLLTTIDTGANGIRMLWDDRFQGLHVFVTPLAAPAASTHFFYEQRTNAWWTDVFGNNNHSPLAMCTLDGNTPGDRVPLIGSWDGYVRTFSKTATTDDGTNISSQVVIGPFLTKNFGDLLLKDIQAIMGETSGNVTYSIFTGTTAEKALSSTAALTGTWGPGRNLTNQARRAAHAIYVQITATNPWAMEAIRIRLADLGKVRQRGY